MWGNNSSSTSSTTAATAEVIEIADSSAACVGTGGMTAGPPLLTAQSLELDYTHTETGQSFSGEGRSIGINFGDFHLVNCYVPNAGEGLKRLDYRLNEWDPAFRALLTNIDAIRPVIMTGDLNCGFLDLDIHNPTAKHIVKQAGLTPQERASFALYFPPNGPFTDAFRHFHPEARGQFTYWSQRTFARGPNKGLRLDYFICSQRLFDSYEATEATETAEGERKVRVHDSYILHEETRGCSDHCPVMLVLEIA